MKVPEDEIKPKYYLIFKKYLKKAGISVAEWHSIIFGVCGAIIGGLPLAGAVWTGVTSVKKTKLSNHMKDLREEAAYFLASFIGTEYLIELINLLVEVVI